MPAVKDILHQFVVRYRRALLTKAGVLAVLSLGIAVVLFWKLRGLKGASWWSLGVVSVIALLALAGLLWWLRRRWMDREHVAVQLDRTLRLQERLVTAEEFSAAAEPPTLYPTLVHETQQLLTAGTLPGLPRAFDRTAGALAVVLLLLLLWPVPGRPGMQLARVPLGQVPEPSPPQPTPSGATSSEDRQPGASSPSPSSSPQASQPSSPSQGQGAQQEPQRGEGESDQQSAGQQPSSSSGAGEQPSQASEERSDQAGRESSARPSEGRETGQEGQQRAEADGQGGGQDDQLSPSPGDEDGPQDNGQLQQMASARRDSSKSKGSAEGAGATGDVTQAPHDSSARWEQQGGGGGVGNQETLKAEIQQLLKELSGELHELQAQLAAADSQAPQPGTQTDPELYGIPNMPEGQRGASVPIQLGTDAQAVNGKRQGGGVGKASGEVSPAAPQAADDVAQLSEQSLELAPASRQPVPPEYRGVFERLYERNTPNEQ